MNPNRRGPVQKKQRGGSSRQSNRRSNDRSSSNRQQQQQRNNGNGNGNGNRPPQQQRPNANDGSNRSLGGRSDGTHVSSRSDGSGNDNSNRSLNNSNRKKSSRRKNRGKTQNKEDETPVRLFVAVRGVTNQAGRLHEWAIDRRPKLSENFSNTKRSIRDNATTGLYQVNSTLILPGNHNMQLTCNGNNVVENRRGRTSLGDVLRQCGAIGAQRVLFIVENPRQPNQNNNGGNGGGNGNNNGRGRRGRNGGGGRRCAIM